MNTECVTAVLGATVKVLQEMGFEDAHHGDVRAVGGVFSSSDSSSVTIGVNGALLGCLVLTFSLERAAALASAVAQMELTAQDAEDVRDSMAELANIVAGHVASGLSDQGIEIGITPPTVVLGPTIKLEFPSDADTFLSRIATGGGSFEFLASLREAAPLSKKH